MDFLSQLDSKSDGSPEYIDMSPAGRNNSPPCPSSPSNQASIRFLLLNHSDRRESENEKDHDQRRKKAFSRTPRGSNIPDDGRNTSFCSSPFFYIFVLILLSWIIFQLVLFYFASTSISTPEFVNGISTNVQQYALRRRIVTKLTPPVNLPDANQNIQSQQVLLNQNESRILSKVPYPSVAAPIVNPATTSSVSTVVPPASSEPFLYSEDEKYILTWSYGMETREWPYVGSTKYLSELFPKETLLRDRKRESWRKSSNPSDSNTNMRLPWHYYNSLAVFPHQDKQHLHGRLGVWSNGTLAYTPKPMPVKAENHPGGIDGALKNGGFYLDLSNALPLDREAIDTRDSICLNIKYNLTELDDVSIIITFYNEPLSSLLRSVHSVLNRTPPPLIREIILVDDHSNITDDVPGGKLYSYIRTLPKVKLTRLPERRGIVTGRLVGAKLATAPVIVILDSHIEINEGWLEPQLLRLKQSPKSLVFPQIPGINPKDFSYIKYAGIGCFVSFKWLMQERSFAIKDYSSPDALPSPAMAGGLWAMNREWFWELGGYDEEFSMWGAENIEQPFRTWMCGGRVECTPCSKVYHIYREKGTGYSSPTEALLKNRLRTARLWTDDFYQLAKRFISENPFDDLGNFDKMLSLKERLKCKSFQWFLDNVDPTKQPRLLDLVSVLGELRNKQFDTQCIDTLQHTSHGDEIGTYGCHGQGGTQGYFMTTNESRIHLAQDETTCLSKEIKISDCENDNINGKWNISESHIRWDITECLTLVNEKGKFQLKLLNCDSKDKRQEWMYKKFQRDFQFQRLEPSYEYKQYQRRLQHRFNAHGIY